MSPFVRDYFLKSNELSQRYGEKSIVLIQNGVFYEAYGLRDAKSEIVGSKLLEFATLCDLAIGNKHIRINDCDVVFTGFQRYSFEKYKKVLQHHGYTISVWDQDEQKSGTKRSLAMICSPGTDFVTVTSAITNNTMCVWMERIQEQIVIGVSNIDVYTGNSFIFEYMNRYSTTPDIYDELERYISIYNPSEIIIIHNLCESVVRNVVNFTSMKRDCLHVHDIHKANTVNKGEIVNCQKQIYQKEIINRFFIENTFEDYCMIYTIAIQSYCYLLNFIFQHNPYLIKNINEPVIENISDRVLLANHTLKQLNMLDTGTVSGKLSSVVTFFNQCKTDMGKRKFKYTLLNPTKNTDSINSDYHLIDHIQTRNDVAAVRDLLGGMKDLERMTRKILIKKVTPADLYHLYNNLDTVLKLYTMCKADPTIMNIIAENIETDCFVLQELLNQTLELDKCVSVTNLSFDSNFVKKGFEAAHDRLVEDSMDCWDKLDGIRVFLNDKVFLIAKKCKDHVKHHKTEKMGSSLLITKNNMKILKKSLTEGTSIIDYVSSYDGITKKFVFDHKSMAYLPALAGKVSISNIQVETLCNQLKSSKTEMLASVSTIFDNLVAVLTTHLSKLDTIVTCVSNLDFNYCKAYIATKYNHCRPKIDPTYPKSFVSQKGLRHPLIENLIQDEIYVTNDIVLDQDNIGILLFGTNAVGKSSLIKALGISIIMAQAGFFVPCEEFLYKPYHTIFTRILGNDNIFKGLSSFAVEMVEFKTILSLANENSLILGDELCSGTENNSAISIFLAGIEHLYTKSATFIFATHFHEIVELDEIRDKDKLVLKHLTVSYNKEQDKLIYDRKLKDGSGESMYGLEVCKSLHLPAEFLRQANAIRNKYNRCSGSILSYKKSRYNSNKVMGICEHCKLVLSDETHHVHQQKEASDNGYINSFHKNTHGNLVCICSKCHIKIHQT